MRFEGIYTPIITPFQNTGAIDWDNYARVIEWQIENGVSCVVKLYIMFVRWSLVSVYSLLSSV